MKSALTRRLEKLEGHQGKGGPVWPDVIYLVSPMPDGEGYAEDAEDGPFVAFVIGGPFHGIGSHEGESFSEFEQRFKAEFPHLNRSKEQSQNNKNEGH